MMDDDEGAFLSLTPEEEEQARRDEEEYARRRCTERGDGYKARLSFRSAGMEILIVESDNDGGNVGLLVDNVGGEPFWLTKVEARALGLMLASFGGEGKEPGED